MRKRLGRSWFNMKDTTKSGAGIEYMSKAIKHFIVHNVQENFKAVALGLGKALGTMQQASKSSFRTL